MNFVGIFSIIFSINVAFLCLTLFLWRFTMSDYTCPECGSACEIEKVEVLCPWGGPDSEYVYVSECCGSEIDMDSYIDWGSLVD